MSLYAELQKVQSDENVKDAYIKALGAFAIHLALTISPRFVILDIQ